MRLLGLILFAFMLVGPIAMHAQDETSDVAVAEEATSDVAEVEVADPLADLDTGDTAFMLICAALVLFMTPGLAFFYGGLVRRKNILSILMQCFMCMCLMTILWVACGYSMSFGATKGGFVGDPSTYAFFKGVGAEPKPDSGHTIPHALFAIFQGMFAIITPALMIGAFAERMKFRGFMVFAGLWLFACYTPLCHWAWSGEGFFSGGDAGTLIMQAGEHAIDFAGGTVVHINAAIAALVAAFYLGKRQGFPERMSPPHSLPFAVLGAGMLWVGWFGFNAGSELAADSTAVSAFVVTHISAAMAGLVWSLLEWVRDGKPTILGMISGVVAGLVAITPACGNVDPVGAMILGALASVVAYIFVAIVKVKVGYDDTLDVWGIHGMAGIIGAIGVGFLAVEGAGMAQAWVQTKSVLATIIYTGPVTLILLKLVDMTFGLKADDHNERVGLDLSEHAEHAYTMVD